MMVLLVALIVLGPKRLPEAGRQVGRALAEMRRWSARLQDEVRDTLDATPEPGARPGDEQPGVPEAPGRAELPSPDPPPSA
jgi:Sec-independent protein translocase protein TatA